MDSSSRTFSARPDASQILYVPDVDDTARTRSKAVYGYAKPAWHDDVTWKQCSLPKTTPVAKKLSAAKKLPATKKLPVTKEISGRQDVMKTSCPKTAYMAVKTNMAPGVLGSSYLERQRVRREEMARENHLMVTRIKNAKSTLPAYR